MAEVYVFDKPEVWVLERQDRADSFATVAAFSNLTEAQAYPSGRCSWSKQGDGSYYGETDTAQDWFLSLLPLDPKAQASA